jgi:hypothetical protein
LQGPGVRLVTVFVPPEQLCIHVNLSVTQRDVNIKKVGLFSHLHCLIIVECVRMGQMYPIVFGDYIE